MSVQNVIDQCPWFGPLPCEEWHATRFYGRTKEIKDLIPKIRTQNLTVISAASGVGKTSLINAGLIPALRLGRERASDAIGFTLCVRKWGAIITRSGNSDTPKNAAQVMIDAITESLKELRQKTAETLKEYRQKMSPPSVLLGINCLRNDLKTLRSIRTSIRETPGNWDNDLKSLEKYLSDLRDSIPGGNLIIIADQAEEYMGSGAQSPNQTCIKELDVFESIIHLKGTRLVISLRKEYMEELRPLEDRFPPFAPRVYHLSPLTWDIARKVIKLSTVEEADVVIDEQSTPVIDQILSWASSPLTAHEKEQGDVIPVDMLAVQAFLFDLYKRGKTPNEKLIIDGKYLKTYMEELFLEEPKLAKEGAYLPAGPMLRWIDNAFDSQDNLKNFLINRIAANMGTVLSTPRGFKSYTTEADLIYHAIRKDLQMCKYNKKQIVGMDVIRDALVPNNKIENEFLKGLSKELFDAARETIGYLLKGNILKIYGTDMYGILILSLQHDGYAPAFTEWCEDLRRHENDCLAPRVGSHGTQIRRKTDLEKITLKKLSKMSLDPSTVSQKSLIVEDLKELVWIGCDIRDVKIINMKFEKCDFTGSYMLGCKFINCEFRRCTFDGTFFGEGTYFSDVKFVNCEMKGMVAKPGEKMPNVWENVEFVNSNLSSAVVQGITLSGRLNFTDKCKALYAQLYKFIPDETGNMFEITAKDFDLHGALFENFDENDTARFINCKNTTQFTTIAPE